MVLELFVEKGYVVICLEEVVYCVGVFKGMFFFLF